jgi:Holliday junction resolvasome RuvABC DNA-binding subunit
MKPVITDITGIGPAAAAALAEHHIKTVAHLATASVETITAIPGFSTARAEQVIVAASELLAASAIAPSSAREEQNPGKKDKSDKKDKKKGKGKKDKKKGKGKK